MKKKALSLVLASAMVASLVGCGSSAETETPSAAESTTTEAAATTEAASTEAAATEAATTDNSDKKIAMMVKLTESKHSIINPQKIQMKRESIL